MGAVKRKFEEVRELLETTDLSVADIADECGVSVEWVNDVLRNIREQENWADNDDAAIYDADQR